MAPKLELSSVQQILNTFPATFKSMVLATVNDQHQPLSSYAPFVKKDNEFYILISRTAPHYANLINHPHASVQLLQDEKEANSVFFRQRLNYTVEATLVPTEPSLIELFKQVHGEMVSMLVQLDFSFFRLQVNEGLIVLGPGQAFVVDATNTVIRQQGAGGMGHGSKP